MTANIKVSIIIINYNYGHFLKDSIESCLKQSYENIEIIIVDDGSTDNSRIVIERYTSVKKKFQKNKGMMEAANTGFKTATGDLIMFLDADDYLSLDAVEQIIEKWDDSMSMLHFRLEIINSNGDKTGYIPKLKEKLSEGNVCEKIKTEGSYVNSPMSGNVYSKKILDIIFPVKNSMIGDSGSYFNRINTDAYLKNRIPFFGQVGAIQKALGIYRIHGDNNGVTTYNYFNKHKRQRKLFMAKMSAVFIKEHFSKKNIKWDESTLFRAKRMMIVRILSLYLDKEAHLWKHDSRFSLFLIIVKNYFSPPYKSILVKTINYFLLIFFCIIPKNMVMFILKKYFLLKKKKI